MISPEIYIRRHLNDTVDELIKERESLIESIKMLEKLVYSDNKMTEEWMVAPTPDVAYQMYLSYLDELCNFMSEKYNKEIKNMKIMRNQMPDDDRYCPIAKKIISENVCYEVMMCLTSGFNPSSVPEVDFVKDEKTKKICWNCEYSE